VDLLLRGGGKRLTLRVMSFPVVQVDAFTDTPFAGNPAAVCMLDAPHDERWMQDVAREMNLSETAFLYAENGGYRLRWFTPAVEVALCGHATLASAHVLWETGQLALTDAARFHTRSGLLTASRRDGWIELDFPATPETEVEPPPGLVESLGVSPRYVGKSRFDYLVEVDEEKTIRALQPDFRTMAAIKARGVIVTARAAASGVDFVSRYFAPAFGIDEDPVTGSTHCCLAPFWSTRLHKREFVAHQLSARGGVLKVALDGDRVRLRGQAVTVLRGELLA
jgi:PhzF family phenazine biosynthesis protein